jgi:hypothetical protein
VPSDPRWTGGIANREWTRGHPAGHVIDRDRLTAQVDAYLADCRKHRAIINPAYHPTEAGALKIICHRSDEEAAVIRDLYRAAMPGQPSMEARDA